MELKRFIAFALLVMALCGTASSQELEVVISVDWQMSVQGGVEYRFSDRAGIKGDIGISALGLFSADLYGVIYLSETDSPWQFMALIGIPNANTPLTFEGAMVSAGGAIEVKRSLNERFSTGIIAGAGFPFFFEPGTDVIRDIDFPLDLWPELALCLSIEPR